MSHLYYEENVQQQQRVSLVRDVPEVSVSHSHFRPTVFNNLHILRPYEINVLILGLLKETSINPIVRFVCL